MLVAGIMSGTSADGINVALARFFGRGLTTRMQLAGHSEIAYPRAVRQAVLAAMNAKQASVADLARLNVVLAELYAEAVLKAQHEAGEKCSLIGCHGQTLYHQGEPSAYLGRKIACTWQTGEASVLAARVGVPVVSDFRPADMAAGGKGAPLVPYLDFLLYRHRRRGRIVQNIGGIANLTAIPAAASPEDVIAFDSGPGSMVIDAVAAELFRKTMDRDGAFAARGNVIEAVANEALAAPYFQRRAPKTAGREEFGREFVRWLLQRCAKAPRQDVIATATALTARSIGSAVAGLAASGNYHDFIVSGGGTRNRTLMWMISEQMKSLSLTIRTTDEHGLPGEAKEAAAFALLAYQTWHRQPSNVPSATGAAHSAILGKITYV